MEDFRFSKRKREDQVVLDHSSKVDEVGLLDIPLGLLLLPLTSEKVKADNHLHLKTEGSSKNNDTPLLDIPVRD